MHYDLWAKNIQCSDPLTIRLTCDAESTNVFVETPGTETSRECNIANMG